jgi:Flagellar biosynthesis protein, FliO
VIAAAVTRLAASPRGRAAVLAAAVAAAALLALSPGGLAPAAARAALAAAAVAALAVLARRRTRAAPAPLPLAVVARQPLANGSGLAVVEAGPRRLLVGFGRDGVRLLADLGASDGRTP